MADVSERLTRGAAVLKLLERRRIETGLPDLGTSIERSVISRELRELEEEILRNPGALASQFARIRHSEPPADTR